MKCYYNCKFLNVINSFDGKCWPFNFTRILPLSFISNFISISIYIYIEREREREIKREIERERERESLFECFFLVRAAATSDV